MTSISIAYVLAFASAATVVYLCLTALLPQVRARIAFEYSGMDHTLKSGFYTGVDAKTYVALKYGGPVVGFLIGLVLFSSTIFGLFIAVLVYLVPSVLVRRVIAGRRDALERQSADVMAALSATVKSGMTLEQSIEEIATKMRPPISQEFALIKDRIDAGETIVAALRAADARLGIPRLSLIFQTIVVGQERGGRLAVLLDRLSESVREIQRVEERVKTETSGLRLSARIMVFMPFVICGFLYLAAPDQIGMLFTTLVGNVILVVAIAVDIAAFKIMERLIDLDA
jgi:Flp pilus assembly protein TadB